MAKLNRHSVLTLGAATHDPLRSLLFFALLGIVINLTLAVSHAHAQQRCGSFSCLELIKAESGYQARVIPTRPGIYACYLRYENTRIVDDQVTIALGPVRLKEGYPPSMLQFRCDPRDTCPAWMRNAGMCSKHQALEQ